MMNGHDDTALVERLRERVISAGWTEVEPGKSVPKVKPDPLCRDAADAIERLTAALSLPARREGVEEGVTQVDRDAFADHLNPEGLPEEPGDWVYAVRHGEADDCIHIQLLRRHRVAATPPPAPEDAVERVARAIWEKQAEQIAPNNIMTWEKLEQRYKDMMEAQARAALAALSGLGEGKAALEPPAVV